MSAPLASRFFRQATRSAVRLHAVGRQAQRAAITYPKNIPVLTSQKCFSVSPTPRAGLMPDSENPEPPKPVEEARPMAPTEIDDDTYNKRADEYLDTVNEKAEQIQEEREDVEVEYSAGVMNITMPGAGTYVLNKQPPNKQIWLSSPTSGPKRYDWVVDGEGMNEKEGSGVGDWIYLRDGSSLTDLLRKELGIAVDIHGHEQAMKESTDPLE